jgi:hypothetical protein
MSACTWTGVSGYPYVYDVHPLGTPLADIPGNYILCSLGPDGYFHPLYFGEAEQLSVRCCPGHEKWLAAIFLGATHIHARYNPGGAPARRNEERDLRRGFPTPLNDQ